MTGVQSCSLVPWVATLCTFYSGSGCQSCRILAALAVNRFHFQKLATQVWFKLLFIVSRLMTYVQEFTSRYMNNINKYSYTYTYKQKDKLYNWFFFMYVHITTVHCLRSYRKAHTSFVKSRNQTRNEWGYELVLIKQSHTLVSSTWRKVMQVLNLYQVGESHLRYDVKLIGITIRVKYVFRELIWENILRHL